MGAVTVTNHNFGKSKMSKDLILRFAIIGTDTTTQEQSKIATKALPVRAGEQICEVQEKLRGKIEDIARQAKMEPDYAQCLYLPPAEGKRGVWLQPERTFADYMEGGRMADDAMTVLNDKDTLEYRKTKRLLRVLTQDLSLNTLLVDNWKTIAEVMDDICKKLHIPNNKESSLAFRTDKREEEELDKDDERIKRQMRTLQEKKNLHTEAEVYWLNHDQTLVENGVREDEVLLMKRKFYHSEDSMKKENPKQLKMFYEQAKQAILKGTHPVPEDTAKILAAYQMQIQFGDYIKERQIDIKSCLPEDLKNNASSMKKELTAEYEKKKGLSEIDAIFEYVNLARGLDTFGIHFFLVREQQKDLHKMVPLLMGVSKDKILRLDTTTKKPKEELELKKVTNYACTDKILKVNFRDKNFTVLTSEGQKIQDLIEGYTLKLKEKQEQAQREKEAVRNQ